MKPTTFDPIGYAVSKKNYPFYQTFIFGHSRNLSSEVFGENLDFLLITLSKSKIFKNKKNLYTKELIFKQVMLLLTKF